MTSQPETVGGERVPRSFEDLFEHEEVPSSDSDAEGAQDPATRAADGADRPLVVFEPGDRSGGPDALPVAAVEPEGDSPPTPAEHDGPAIDVGARVSPERPGRLYRSAGAGGSPTETAIPAYVAGPSADAANSAEPAAVPRRPGLTYLGVFAVVTVPTFAMGLAQGLILDRITWPTGLTMLISSAAAALKVRHGDFAAAVAAPPLAFLVTVLLAGQLTLNSQGSLLLREGFMVFRALAENAPWIIGSTVVAAAIVGARWMRERDTGGMSVAA